MTFKFSKVLAITLLLSFIVIGKAFAYSSDSSCPVDPTWISNPSMPTEVKKSEDKGTSSNFCDFYQFSWQAYFYLMSPVSKGSDTRQFQVAANYPLMEFNADGSPANSCDETMDGTTFRTALDKTSITTHQAGGGAVIYDQNGQVVYYDMRFNKAMCNQTGSAVEMAKNGVTNFPAGTTELKFAWKVLGADEINSNSFVTQTPTSGPLKGLTLGLIGMHIAIATDDHPEFVWASFEHTNNAPNCSETSDKAWSFTSKQCASTLPGGFTSKPQACAFNAAEKSSATTGTPTEICRQYPNGTAPTDPNADENNGDIDTTNKQVVSLLAKASDPQMQKLKDYFILGALWVSKPAQDSDISNQRGSLRLANPIAETTFQDVDITSKSFISNCFGCHNFAGTGTPNNNNITSGNLSHIFFDIQTGQGKAVDIQASTIIMMESQAPDICNATCSGYGLSWNKDWTNQVPGTKSVCGCQAK